MSAPKELSRAAAVEMCAARLLNANDTAPGTTWAEKHASDPACDWPER